MKLAKLLTFIGLMGVPTLGLSCVDQYCGITEDECGLDSFPFLSPNNDSRINLLLLMSQQNSIPLPVQAAKPVNSLNTPFTGYTLLDYHNYLYQTPVATPLNLPTELNIPANLLQNVQSKPAAEGRCLSNNSTSAQEFITALQQEGELTTEQQHFLAIARLTNVGLCDGQGYYPLSTLPSELQDHRFTRYLLASQHFYQQNYPEAASLFTELSQTSGWIAETANYMQARVALNQAQQLAIDRYGFFDITKTDSHYLSSAKHYLDRYLAQYPKGHYADSAAGLYRRIYWMKSDYSTLAKLYQTTLEKTHDFTILKNLVYEIDTKLLEETFTSSANSPYLTLIQDIKRLRLYGEYPPNSQLTQTELVQQRSIFTENQQQNWFHYVQQLYSLYYTEDYQAVIAAIPPLTADEPLDILNFSNQVVRGLALASANQLNEAEVHWRELLKHSTNYEQQQYLQMILAITLEQGGKVDRIFADDSPVTDLRYRLPLLAYKASEKLLRDRVESTTAIPEERNVALYSLLSKELLTGQYQAFLEDIVYIKQIEPLLTNTAEIPGFNLAIFNWDGSQTQKGYQCPSLSATVTTLTNNAHQPHALNCLGEFFSTSGFEFSPIQHQRPEGSLGSTHTDFPGQFNSRLDFYLQVINNPYAADADKSYALYRAVWCFARSGYNNCGTQEIPKTERKKWFQKLKRDYKETLWAKSLRYYW